MKKIVGLLTTLLLLGTVTLTASAKAGITMTDAVGTSGQTVYITVSLNESVKTDQMSVEYSYDKNILRPLPQSCSWQSKVMMTDFDEIRPYGVWAASNTVEVKDTVCTLAFLVLPGVSFDTTQVSCTLIVMNNDKETGSYSTTSKVSTTCSHSYGPWTSRDEISHIQICTICKEEQVKTHSWDAGKQIQDPDNSANSLMVHTCTVCSGTKSFVMEGVYTPATQPSTEQTQPSTEQTRPQNIQQDATVGTTTPQTQQLPAASAPVTDPFTGEPVTEPDHFHTEPSKNNHDYNDSDHIHFETTPSQYIPVEEDGHDHDHTTEPVDNTATPIVIAVAVALLTGALVFFVKKKW